MNTLAETTPSGRAMDGRRIVVILLALGVLSALGAWLWHWTQVRLSREWWGPEYTELLHSADRVTAVRLGLPDQAPTDRPSERVTFDGREYATLGERDLLKTNGFDYVRRALAQDFCYVWDATPDVAAARWTHVVEFQKESRKLTLLFDLDSTPGLLQQREAGKTLVMKPRMVEFFREFFDARFGLSSARPGGVP